jgi:uncharacterized protein YciI
MRVMRFMAPCLVAFAFDCGAQPPASPAAPAFDAELAKSLGADDLGMRRYVLVILKSGPKQMPAGAERDAMFRGHFANIQRLAGEGKLALAGPFMGGTDGWRGLYVFAVKDIDEARALTATDPVIVNEEMVAEYHPWYGTAALLQVNDVHKRIAKQQP